MLSWIATRVFYALVFFALGAWSATHSTGFKDYMHNIGSVVGQQFDRVRDWTSTTLSPPVPMEAKAPDAGSQPVEAATTTAAPVTAQPAAPTQFATIASVPSTPASYGDEVTLTRARDAYARKDVNAAIAAYLAYIGRHPEEVDARGELGNVFYSAGKTHEAAQMYFQAATLHLEGGDVSGARAFLGAVRQTDAALADVLARAIETSDKK